MVKTPGDGDSDGSPAGEIAPEASGPAGVPGKSQVSERIDALIERGLERYGEGDLDGALGEWEHALALDPGAQRAQEYLDYVTDNFAELESQFGAARAAKESGVPVPEIPEEVSGAYDLVQLEQGLAAPGGDAESVPLDLSRSRAIDDPMAPFEPEWSPEDLPAEPLPPPPRDTRAETPVPGDDDGALDDEPLDLGGVGGDDDIPLGDAPGRAYDDDEDGEVLVLEPGDDEPGDDEAGAPPIDMEAGEEPDEVTMPGGDEPPPLPERPALVEEAIQALSHRVAPVIIRPRQEGTSPGTVPGFFPNALPAPPTVATPAELLLDDLGGADDVERADRSSDGLDIDMSSDDGDGEITGEVDIGLPSIADDRSDDAATPASRRRHGGSGIGEPLDAAALGLAGDDTGEATFTAGARGLRSIGEDMPTIERHAARGLSMIGDAPIDLDGPSERGAPPRPRTGTTGPAVIVDASLLQSAHETGEEDEPTHMRARIPTGVHEIGAADASEEAVRRRISDLLTLARQASERGDFTQAVAAAEAAANQDPDGKVGPVILHRHRDLLYRVYEAHIGEMAQVPLLAVPIHQIAAENFDHRAGFLLSRIDGMLSFEDILDVAGMPRLDAYRILSNLLRKGLIEVR